MNRFLRWGSALFYIALLTVFLVRPVPATFRPLFPHADKVEHFLAMGLLSVLLLRAMTDPRADRPSTPAAIAACLIAISYGVGMEFAQAHVGRDFSVGDMLADAVGVLVLTPVWVMLRSRSVFFR